MGGQGINGMSGGEVSVASGGEGGQESSAESKGQG